MSHPSEDLYPSELLYPTDSDYPIFSILDRLKSRFTTPYNTEIGSNIDNLMLMMAAPIAEASDVLDGIVKAHQLSEATGHSLDQWGNLLQVTRDTGETDDHYRARLITHSLIYRRSATVQDMVSSCAGVLEIDTDRVSLTDGSTPAAFDMSVYLSDIVDAGLTLSNFSDIMKAAKAAGVDLTITGEGSFECKAIAGGHDATKGYNNIANGNPTGGVYSGLIGAV